MSDRPPTCLGGRRSECIGSRLRDQNRESSIAVSWNPASTDNERWRVQVACRYPDANLLFSTGSTGVAVDQIEVVKAVCGYCPVTDPCLQYALETNEEAGSWGGTGEDERRRLRRVWRESGGRRKNG